MRATPAALARQYWLYGRGRARTVLKHRLRPQPRQLAPVFAVGGLTPGLLLAPLQPASLLLPAGYLGLLAGASLWTALRRRSATGLWVGPALAAMHLPWGAGFVATTIAHAWPAPTRIRSNRQASCGAEEPSPRAPDARSEAARGSPPRPATSN